MDTIPVPLNPFSLSLGFFLDQQQFFEAEMAVGKSPCSKTQSLTYYDKCLEAEQKQRENSYYLNDRAHWQAVNQLKHCILAQSHWE